MSADEMFEKLGYMKLLIGNNIKYFKDYDNVYHFLINDKEYYKSGEYDGTCGNTTMKELQAINKKCEELGWL